MATTKTAKVVTYTEAQASELKAAYVAADSVEARDAVKAEFAAKFGKTVKSIVAKLVRMEVYVKAEYVTKSGAKPVAKDDTADKIGALLGMTEAEVTSLTKANKTALVKIEAAVLAFDILKGQALKAAEAE
jgi:hypothetical protein